MACGQNWLWPPLAHYWSAEWFLACLLLTRLDVILACAEQIKIISNSIECSQRLEQLLALLNYNFLPLFLVKLLTNVGGWILDSGCHLWSSWCRAKEGGMGRWKAEWANDILGERGGSASFVTRVHWRLWGRARLGMFLRLKELRIMAYRCHAPLIFTYQELLALSEPILGVFFYISSSSNSGSIWYKITSTVSMQVRTIPEIYHTNSV